MQKCLVFRFREDKSEITRNVFFLENTGFVNCGCENSDCGEESGYTTGHFPNKYIIF